MQSSVAYTISEKAIRFRHPDYYPDRAQNLISSSMSRHLSTCNISSKSMHAFLSNLANRQTDKQTNKHGQNMYLLLCRRKKGKTRTDFARRAFRCSAPTVWDSLPETIISAGSLAVFKSRLKTYFNHRWPCVRFCRSTSVEQPTIWHSNIYTIIRHVQETYEILPLSTVFFQPVELVTTCTLTMLGALEVVRAAYCAL